jgi:hypothetical protein
MSFDQLTTNYINTPESSVSYWDVCDLIDWDRGSGVYQLYAKYSDGNIIGKDYYTSDPDNSATFDPSAHFLTRNELVSSTESADQWNKDTGQFTINESGIYDISWRFRFGNDTTNQIKLEILDGLDNLVSTYIINDCANQGTDVIVGSKNIYLEQNYKFQFKIFFTGNTTVATFLFNARVISHSGFTVVRYR